MRWTALYRIVVFALLFAPLLAFVPSAHADDDSHGSDFWLAFEQNLDNTDAALTLFIGSEVDTTGTVAIPGLAFSTNFSVTAGATTAVELPVDAYVATFDGVEDRGIHVTAQAEVSVYGLNQFQYTTDAFLGLPTDILGTAYRVMSYAFVEGGNPAQFAVVATQDGTTVTITPTVTIASHAAGVPYNVALDQGEVYQLRGEVDPTGTLVTADKPVAVFSGHSCSAVPVNVEACDVLIEQVPPVAIWGKDFVTMPLATRLNGDTFRFLASADDTQVSVNGAVVATLDQGQFHERIIAGSARITADKPILVAQYAHGVEYDNVTGDPFMILIPPAIQFPSSYTVATPGGFESNHITVVAPNAVVGSITLDGTAIPAGNFTAIPGSDYSGAHLTVAAGSHRLAGSLPFGITVYGFSYAESYGYPGGITLEPPSLVLAPKTAAHATGTQHCVTATLTDAQVAPIVGIAVDFAVTGANATTGQATTGAGGQAQFCYTGTAPGHDTITASVGVLSDTAAATWLATLTLQIVGSGTVGVTPSDTNGGSTTQLGGTASYLYEPGTVVTLTPAPSGGGRFTDWTLDGNFKGWAHPATLMMDTNHTLVATFATAKIFSDVGNGRDDSSAIVELATRGTIRGYDNSKYGPDDSVQRAQMAALIARAMLGGPGTPPTTLTPPACLVAGTWDCEMWPNNFTDRNGLDGNLWRNVGALQHYLVALGYTAGDCATKGMTFPCFGPTDPVTYAETITFITRAMIAKGYWVAQPNAPQPYPGVPAVFAGSVATFHYYTQGLGGVPTPPANWNAPATRGWFARVLWQALTSYWGTDGQLPEGRDAGGYLP